MKAAKEKALKEYLSHLPQEMATPLAVAMEVERLTGKTKFPHDLILDGLRPVLMRSDTPPPRLPTPMRLFCAPFEDMIFANSIKIKQRGRLSRDSLMPIWNWLMQDILADQFDGLVGAIQKAILAGEKKAMNQAAVTLHAVAGAKINQVLEGAPPGSDAYRALGEQLGGEKVVEDARDMALVLEASSQIIKVRQDFSRPMMDIQDADLEKIAGHYAVFSEHLPENRPVLFLVLMGRMHKPWQVLSAIMRVGAVEADALLGEGPLADPGNLLLSDVQLLARYFQSVPSIDSNVGPVLKNLAYFNELVKGIESQFTDGGGGQWEHWLMVCRKTVAVALESHLDRALRAIAEALPSKKIGLFGAKGSVRPDIAEWPDEAKVEAAAHYAAFVRGLEQCAQGQAFAASYEKVSQKIADKLSTYGIKIIDEIRVSEGEDRSRAQAHFQSLLRLTRLVMGDAAAEDLSQRAVPTAA